MSAVAFGRTVRLATERASSRSDFRIGLEAIEKETGRLNFDPDVQYDGDGIRFRRGDVLFGKLRPNLRKAWLADADGDAVGDFHVYRPLPERMTSRYLSYLVLSEPFLEPVIASVSGAKMPRADWNEVRNVKVWVPSLSEQQAIADYLDRETAQIDAFIAKNEELITLLTERRAAVTAQAVTRGIDDSGELKESGLGWLGSIPEDWEAVRVKFAVRSLPGFAFASGDFVDDTGATRLLRGINVGVGSISWAETVGIENPPADVERRYMLDEGDLVLGMDRPVISGGLRVARVGPGDAGSLLVQRVLRLRGTRVRNDYLEYSLAWGGFAMYIEPDFTGVSVPHMSEQQVGNFAIALPDLSTQERIVDYLRDQHSAIDTALDAARRSIDLMRERRAALISAAVTGKIDVGVVA
ncbi:hypothetical protein RYJ27_08335 [Microbacterium limosum]|uniref:Type I restriction enzyme S subunit n=1 Tax=Microbacterium limosum TaxID=3079935 RepID=A0AAU0ME63_9MICO|nr:hypothetical protein [Microbacterium sp. Y20]WOQ68723.1 hypothetical protein RYJ27_08335 [Microbacterium sp. Y20]